MKSNCVLSDSFVKGKAMRKILSYLTAKEWIFTIIAIIMALSSIYTDMSIPSQMSKVTTLIQTPDTTIEDIAAEGLMMIAYAFIGLMFSVIMMFLSAKVGTAMAMRIRKAVFDKTLSFSMKEMGDFSTSSLITRCTLDITRIQNIFSVGILLLFKAPVTAVWAFSRILGKDYRWTITAGIILAGVLIFMIVIVAAVLPLVSKMQAENDNINRISREHITGIRVVHAFNAFKFQDEKFDYANESLSNLNRKSSFRTSTFAPGLDIASNLLNISIYAVGAIVIGSSADSEKIGLFSDMVTFSSYALLVMAAFIQLLIVFLGLAKGIASIRRINEVLDREIEIVDGEEKEEITKTGTIEFKNVDFRYPGAAGMALSDINIRVEKGQTVAFIGATGSGKTSILNLIPRFYDVENGEIKVDGRNVKDYKLKDLRNRIGYIPQKSMLFSGTVAGNIAYGDNGRFKATITEIMKAAEVGQAKEFIEKKEGGYAARVSEGGKNYSGGQKQRLTISRAIARDPEIYLFDDSFSALDYKTDRILRKKLKEVAGDATVIIVAQRIGTIRTADRIYVVDEGRIVGSGTHSELLKECDVYKEIAKSQMTEEELRA